MGTKNKLNDSDTKLYEMVLNRYMSKKYDWFQKIDIKDVGYSERAPAHMAINGTIYVDENWLYNQWRKYHYSTPFPDIKDEEYAISLGDFIGGDLSEDLQKTSLTLFAGVTNLPRPKYTSWSWIEVRTIEDEDKKIMESIKSIIKENSKKDKIKKLIDKVGFENACKSVGGIQNVAKLIDVRPIELLDYYFIGTRLSTTDLEKYFEVGGYDFEFMPTAISENYMEGIYIDYTITKGTINLIHGTGETFDLFDPELRKKEYWWEIEYELIDIFRDYSRIYLERLNYNMDEDTVVHIEVHFDNQT